MAEVRTSGGSVVLHAIWYLITGFIIGLVARAVLPGADRMGMLATAVVGIVGSFLGGFITRAFTRPEPGSAFHPAGFVMSIVGAIVVLLLWRMVA